MMKQPLAERSARVRRGQLRALSVGAGACAFALACSGGQGDHSGSASSGQVTSSPDGDLARPSDRVDRQPAAAPAPAAVQSGPFADATDLLAQQVKAILQLNCAVCHEGANDGSLSYVLDYQQLVANKQIIPGNSADSPIFVRMTQQQMPPAEVTAQRPSLGEIELVGQWIDSLQKSTLASCAPLPFVTSDEQLAMMADDVASLPSAVEPFTRYLTLTYASNTGDCGLDLQRQRYALFKAINSVSTNSVIGNPVPIDTNETIYRIDMRDYNWDRPIDLRDRGIVDFNDGWLSLVAAAQPFAVEYQGDQADALKADTQTPVPFMPVNAFVQASQFGDEYYALIGGKALFQDFARDVLGIDQQAAITAEQVVRAGFQSDGVARQEHEVIRFDSKTGDGHSLWMNVEFNGGSVGARTASDSIFANPLDIQNAAGEALFNLPNGMQGYYVSLGDGSRLNVEPQYALSEGVSEDEALTTGASCHSCHNAGVVSFGDQVRQFVIDNQSNFDTGTYQQVMDTFPDQAALRTYIDAASAIQVNATVEAGLPRGTPDPVSRLYFDFQFANITTAQVAGELNVTKDLLVQNLGLLDPTLQDLGNPDMGFVERPVLQNVFLQTVCALHSADVNTPVACP